MKNKNVDELKLELENVVYDIKQLKKAEDKYYYLKEQVEQMDIDLIEVELCIKIAKKARLTHLIKIEEQKQELIKIEDDLKELKAEQEFLWISLSDREEQMDILKQAVEILENEMIEEDVKMLFKKSIVHPLEIEIDCVEFELLDNEDEINKLEARKAEIIGEIKNVDE